jgi:AcrR family transcriptional regulator
MPRRPDPEKRRQLARRAVEVLRAEGLAISSARLAEALQIKRPTLLYHFPTHGHIVEAALEDLLTEQAAFVLGRLAGHSHPVDRLFAQLCAVHEFHHGHEARIVFLTQAIAATAGGRLPAILEVGNRVFEAHRLATQKSLEEGMAAGTVAPCNAAALVALVRALIDGLLVQRVVTGIALPPVHRLIWENVLGPLKLLPPARPAPSARPRNRSNRSRR